MKEDHIFVTGFLWVWSRGSSVSIVSDYIPDDQATRVRSLAEAKEFSSSLCVQTGSGADGSFPQG
jgi:hypothetical protein